MIYKVIGYLFRNDYGTYKAKPYHVAWALFVMAIGTVTFVYDGWAVFGIATFIIGALLGIAIVFSVAWEKRTEYWETVTSFAQVMIKSNNPDLWQALGFKNPPQQVTIQEVKQADNESGYQVKFHKVPVSPSVMQLIADTVLHSGKNDFIESDYGHIPNIRKVRDKLKEQGLISPRNKKNVRLGYTFNKKGLEVLYQYASEGVKLELKRR